MNINFRVSNLKEEYIGECREQKHLLWEITGACNQRCKYCYSSRTKEKWLDKEDIIHIARKIAESEFEYIHITGGEPTLCKGLREAVEILHNKKIYITTNLLMYNEKISDLFCLPNIYSVAVSLDSNEKIYNDFLRGNTEVVIANLKKLIESKKQKNARYKVRIHCVITMENIEQIPEFLVWAKEIGVAEVSCQPVSLNESHEFAELLNLKKDELPILEKIYELESKLFGTRYSETHNEWMKLYLQNQKISIEFMEHICIPYIDAMGKIWSCPCKKEILSDIKLVNKAEKCNISIQCMTCLKHIENIHKV